MLTFTSLASSSAGCAYRVSGGGASNPILLDCGLPFKQLQKALDFKVSELAGVFVSHGHQDHCKSVSALLDAGVDVFASAETWEQMKFLRRPSLGHLLEHGEVRQCTDWSIMPFLVEHDCPGTMGAMIGSPGGDVILYLTDSVYTRFKFEGVTHLCVECNHDVAIVRKNVQDGVISQDLAERILRTHMSIQRLEEMCRVMDKSKLQHIYLLHLSAANSNAAEFKERIERCTGVPVTVCAERMAV